MIEADALERVLAYARRTPFVTLVHLVERIRGDATPVGSSGPFSGEALRFRHDPSLSFQTADVTEARVTGDRAVDKVELTTAFLGLTGAASPLPLLLSGASHEDEEGAAQNELLDVFHHRLLSVLVRGILKFDYPRSFALNGEDAVSRRIFALAELPPEHVKRLSRLDPWLLLRLTPLLAMHPPTEERLRLALVTALHEPLEHARITVQTFAGGLVDVSESERPRLGRSFRLGESASLGARVRAPASKIRIVVEQLDAAALEAFSPGGKAFELLCGVADLVLPPTVDFDVELSPREAIPWRIGQNTKSQLGRSSWLAGTKKPAPVRFTLARARLLEEAP